jgi:hypothetical protein
VGKLPAPLLWSQDQLLPFEFVVTQSAVSPCDGAKRWNPLIVTFCEITGEREIEAAGDWGSDAETAASGLWGAEVGLPFDPNLAAPIA